MPSSLSRLEEGSASPRRSEADCPTSVAVAFGLATSQPQDDHLKACDVRGCTDVLDTQGYHRMALGGYCIAMHDEFQQALLNTRLKCCGWHDSLSRGFCSRSSSLLLPAAVANTVVELFSLMLEVVAVEVCICDLLLVAVPGSSA